MRPRCATIADGETRRSVALSGFWVATVAQSPVSWILCQSCLDTTRGFVGTLGRMATFTATDAQRIIRAIGRTVADTDTNQLRQLMDIQTTLDITLRKTVHDLRAYGFTWGEVGRDLGISRQAAQQRFGSYRCELDHCSVCHWDSSVARDFRLPNPEQAVTVTVVN